MWERYTTDKIIFDIVFITSLIKKYICVFLREILLVARAIKDNVVVSLFHSFYTKNCTIILLKT